MPAPGAIEPLVGIPAQAARLLGFPAADAREHDVNVTGRSW